jgi:hypothetical protein
MKENKNEFNDKKKKYKTLKDICLKRGFAVIIIHSKNEKTRINVFHSDCNKYFSALEEDFLENPICPFCDLEKSKFKEITREEFLCSKSCNTMKEV